MLEAFEGQVGVNLVGNDNDVVVGADFCHAFKFFAQPHTSAGVVGVAQQEQFASLCLLLKVLKVNFVLSVDQLQGVGDNGTFVPLWYMEIGKTGSI